MRLRYSVLRRAESTCWLQRGTCARLDHHIHSLGPSTVPPAVGYVNSLFACSRKDCPWCGDPTCWRLSPNNNKLGAALVWSTHMWMYIQEMSRNYLRLMFAAIQPLQPQTRDSKRIQAAAAITAAAVYAFCWWLRQRRPSATSDCTCSRVEWL